MTTRTKWILGIAGAAVAGAAIGLLLAPEKGTDLRSRITRTTGNWADQLTDVFANAKGEIQNMAKRGSRSASDAANRYS